MGTEAVNSDPNSCSLQVFDLLCWASSWWQAEVPTWNMAAFLREQGRSWEMWGKFARK